MMNSIPTQQVISVLGLAAFIGAAWLMSANRKKIDWRLVVVGILLQVRVCTERALDRTGTLAI